MSRPGSPSPGTDRSADATDAPYGADAGQPRPMEGARRPTAAERVRTLAASNATASLTIPGIDQSDEMPGGILPARSVTVSGDLLTLVPGTSSTAVAAGHAPTDGLTCVIEITDVAPVAMPHRVRGRCWLAGWLSPAPNELTTAHATRLAEAHPAGDLLGVASALRRDAARTDAPEWRVLRLEVGEGYVDDLWGAAPVEPEALRTARPDPLARHETELLQHLHSAHHGELRGLGGLLSGGTDDGRTAPEATRRVVPVALDRFGLRVRFTDPCPPGDRAAGGHSASFDARFDFPQPVADVRGVGRALRELFAAARS